MTAANPGRTPHWQCRTYPEPCENRQLAIMWSRLIAVIAVVSALAWAFPQSEANAPSQKQASGSGVSGAAEVAAPRIVINDHFGDYWSREDAWYIITPEERSAYKLLRNDEERESFIDAFWRRRDPTPDTIANEFEDEHYRRIVYANQLFSGHVVGWKTDRGRMYIMYGPPDSVEFSTLGALSGKPEESQQPYSSVPVEVWRYKYLEGMGCNVVFTFGDKCGCDDLHFVVPHSDPEPLSRQLAEHVCLDHPLTDLSMTPASEVNATEYQRGFIGLVMPPRVRFKDLEEVVTSKVRYNLLPFQAITTAVRATEFTDWIDLTLQFQKKDLTWKQADGKIATNLHLFARFITLTGRVAATVEEEISEVADTHEAQSRTDGILQFSRGVPLPGGRYRVDVAVEDVAADKMGTWSTGLVVPNFYADQFGISPLVLADQIDTPKVHVYPISGELYIGDTRIHPIVPASAGMPAVFHQGQPLGLFFQVYNLSQGNNLQKSDRSIGYKIVDADTGKTVIDLKDATDKIGQGGEQITIRKFLSTTSIPKGEYSLCVTAGDHVSQRTASSTTHVRIE